MKLLVKAYAPDEYTDINICFIYFDVESLSTLHNIYNINCGNSYYQTGRYTFNFPIWANYGLSGDIDDILNDDGFRIVNDDSILNDIDFDIVCPDNGVLSVGHSRSDHHAISQYGGAYIESEFFDTMILIRFAT